MARSRRQASAAGAVEVRMLVDTPHEGDILPCNTVQVLDADDAAAMVGAGYADDTPAAIEAARDSQENRAYQARLEAARKKAAADRDED